MSAVQAAVESRPRQILYVAGYAAIVGAVSVVLAVLGIADGEIPAFGRAALGALGIAGAYLLWTRPRIGWTVLLVWAAIQIPYFAWNTDGSPLAQVIYFPLSISDKKTVNGEITSYSEYGINLVGVVLTLVTYRWRKEWRYRNRQTTPHWMT